MVSASCAVPSLSESPPAEQPATISAAAANAARNPKPSPACFIDIVTPSKIRPAIEPHLRHRMNIALQSNQAPFINGRCYAIRHDRRLGILRLQR